jgi:hypothetical protein
VRYLATLLGTSNQATMRWFILIVALLLDPAAVGYVPHPRTGGTPMQRSLARSSSV